MLLEEFSKCFSVRKEDEYKKQELLALASLLDV